MNVYLSSMVRIVERLENKLSTLYARQEHIEETIKAEIRNE